MSFLTKFEIENFKSIQANSKFQFAPITILTGTNSSGKSSLIGSLRLLKSNFSNISYFNEIFKLKFSKENHNLGNFEQVLNHNATEKQITFSLPFELSGNNDSLKLSISYQLDDSNPLFNGQLTSMRIFLNRTDEIIFSLNRDKDWEIKIDLNYFTKSIKKNVDKILLNKEIEEYKSKGWELFNKIEFDQVSQNEILKQLEKLSEEARMKFNLPKRSQKEILELINKNSNTKIDIKNIEQQKINRDNWQFFYSFDILHKLSLELEETLPSETHSNDFENSFKEWDNLIAFFYPSKNDNLVFHVSEKYELDNHLAFKQEALKIFEKICLIDKTEQEQNFFTTTIPLNKIETQDIDDDQTSPIRYAINKSLMEEVNSILNLFPNDFPYLEKVNRESLEFRLQIHYECTFFEFQFNQIQLSISKAFESLTNFDYLSADRNKIKRIYSFQNGNNEFEKTLLEFLELGLNENDKEIDFFNLAVQKLDIADKIVIENDSEGFGIKPYLIKGDRKTLLADVGYGVSQVLPVILRILILARNNHRVYYEEPIASTLIIEEPETNLHPALQSKLADIFIKAYQDFNIQFILETHSEYLIRKFQYLVAKNEIRNSDVNMYYFYHPEKIPDGEKQIKKIEINTDGSLTDTFGQGFYDEADNIAIELFNLQNAQKN